MSDVALDDGWFSALTAALAGDDAPVGEPADVDVELVVATEAGKVPTRWAIRGGRLTEVRRAADGDDPAAVSVPLDAAQLGSFLAGDADPAIAFMRGDLKPEGSSAAVLALLSAWARPSCRSALAAAGG